MDEQLEQDDSGDIFVPGHIIAGRYEVIRLLGCGGMGRVYLVKDRAHGEKEVAMKILHGEQAHDKDQKQRFLREVQLTSKIHHKNIVRTFDVGTEDDLIYFTMEYIPGKSLEKLMEEGIKQSQIADIIIQICEGLAAIHEADIFHRDLKPGNIIVLDDGTIKITDFGIARPEVSNLTAHNEIIGSIYYMAPEIWLGKKLTASIDLYSLGVMLYELCTGEPPFDGDCPGALMRLHLESKPTPPKGVNPAVPPWLNKLILRLLEKSPLERPRSAGEIIDYVELQIGKKTKNKETSEAESANRHFILLLEEESKRITELQQPSVTSALPADKPKRPPLSSIPLGPEGITLPRLALRLFAVFLALLTTVAGAAGLHLACNTLVPSPTETLNSIAPGVFSSPTILAVLQSALLHGLIALIFASVPGALLGLAAGSFSLAAQFFFSLIVFHASLSLTFFIFTLKPAILTPILHSRSLLAILTEIENQLAALALLSPQWLEHSAKNPYRGMWAQTASIIESPLLLVGILVYLSLLVQLISKALQQRSSQTSLAHLFTVLTLWLLLVIESIIIPVGYCSSTSVFGILPQELPRMGSVAGMVNWSVLYVVTALLARTPPAKRQLNEKTRMRINTAKRRDSNAEDIA